MLCCICYEKSRQKTTCKHNICFACVYNLVNKDNKGRIIKNYEEMHFNNDNLEYKIKQIRLSENQAVNNYVFSCPYCRQIVTDSKFLNKLIKEYVNITVEFYKSKRQFTRDFIYSYVVDYQETRFLKF